METRKVERISFVELVRGRVTQKGFRRSEQRDLLLPCSPLVERITFRNATAHVMTTSKQHDYVFARAVRPRARANLTPPAASDREAA